MKRIIVCLLCILVILLLTSCNSDATPVLSGNYYAVGDYEEMLTPYLLLDTTDNQFAFGPGSVVSYAEHGSYKITDGKIIATSLSTTYEFDIKDERTLVLVNNGDKKFFKIPIGTQFVYSKDLK